MNLKTFGSNPAGKRLERIKQSPNFRDGKFRNLVPTAVNPKDVSFFRILKKMISRPSSVKPAGEIPHVKTDLKELNSNSPAVVWFGHSSYLIVIDGFRILVDPVFSGNASPFRFFGKAFPGADYYKAEDLPEIDLLILTHDHYDHLDWPTIKKIHPKVRKIVTSLGVGAHLELWKVQKNKIIELDWWQQMAVADDVNVTAAPSRHFSGRGFSRAKTLWSSFVLEAKGYRIFIGGDSGYSDTFSELGQKFKSFDLAFMETGQYNEFWPEIHMFPEQSVMAARDLNAKVAIPVHWGKFVLSMHPWNEPVKRFIKKAEAEGIKFVAPKIGEPYFFGKVYNQQEWWEFEKKNYGK